MVMPVRTRVVGMMERVGSSQSLGRVIVAGSRQDDRTSHAPGETRILCISGYYRRTAAGLNNAVDPARTGRTPLEAPAT